jgi:hypothetical protein
LARPSHDSNGGAVRRHNGKKQATREVEMREDEPRPADEGDPPISDEEFARLLEKLKSEFVSAEELGRAPWDRQKTRRRRSFPRGKAR